jgi:ABC-type Fe3+/spermidine/putrescine transport system ATPase subunit
MDLYRRPTTAFAASFLGETNLIPGKATSGGASGSVIEVKTAAGAIRGTLAAEVSDGSSVQISLRPEALKADPSGILAGVVQATTYLGDVAHHLVAADGGVALHVSEFAPGPRSAFQGSVRLAVNPEDAVILAS